MQYQLPLFPDHTKLKFSHRILSAVGFCLLRKLNPDGHQTSVISTNRILSMDKVALYMFSRWSQENFFRFMRQEYNLNSIIEYGVDQVDDNIKVSRHSPPERRVSRYCCKFIEFTLLYTSLTLSASINR